MENILFYFCSAAGPEASGTPNFNKRAVSSVSGSQEEESCEPPPFSPAGSSVLPKSTPSAHSWSQVRSVILESPIHVRGPGPCVPPRCPTAGSTGVVSQSLASAPRPSRWLLRTIRHSYTIKFVRRLPKFRGIRFTSFKAVAACLACRNRSPAGEGCDRASPSSRYEVRVLQHFTLLCPRKAVGLRPILDLQALNRALHKLPFKMLMQKRIFGCIRPLDWFEAIHVSILPLHRPFMRFEFEGCAYQYKVLPFRLSLLPRVFTEVPERPLFP